MTYEEIVNSIDGKPSKATLRVNMGGGTVKLPDVFVRSLEPSAIVAVFNSDREAKFTGKPEDGSDEGQAQSATFRARQLEKGIRQHFGLASKEEESKPRGKSKGKGKEESNPASDGVGAAGHSETAKELVS